MYQIEQFLSTENRWVVIASNLGYGEAKRELLARSGSTAALKHGKRYRLAGAK